jgi:uncharacterized protein YjeT (DUF2065 family)
VVYSLLAALGLFFVLEGLLPLLVPGRWRAAFLQIAQLSDGQIRFFGLASMLFGILLLASHLLTADS